MIDTQLLLKKLSDTPTDARADHGTPLTDRAWTQTAVAASQIAPDTPAEQEAAALVLGMAAHRYKGDPGGTLSIGGLARGIDEVHLRGVGGTGLTRLRHLSTAARSRRPRTVLRYLVEFGKLQRGGARLDLVLLARDAAVVLGDDRDRTQEILSRWHLTYQYGPRATEEAIDSDAALDS